MRLVRYLCVNYVVLDLLLCDGDVLQNDLQPHRHHAGHPVDQAGADVTGHPPLEQQEKIKLLLYRYDCHFFCILSFFGNIPLFELLKYLAAFVLSPSLM